MNTRNRMGARIRRNREGQAILWVVIVGFIIVASLLIALLVQGQNQQALQQAVTDLTTQLNQDPDTSTDDLDADVATDTDGVTDTDADGTDPDDVDADGADDQDSNDGADDGDDSDPVAPPTDTPDTGDGDADDSDADDNDTDDSDTDALSALPDPGSVDGGAGYSVGRDNYGNIINIFIVNSAGVVLDDITAVVARLKVAGEPVDDAVSMVGEAISDAAEVTGGGPVTKADVSESMGALR